MEIFKREGLVIGNSDEFRGWTCHLVTGSRNGFQVLWGDPWPASFRGELIVTGDAVFVFWAHFQLQDASTLVSHPR